MDPSSLNKEFCHYARVKVDVDLQFSLPSKSLVERNGHSFEVSISYEKLPYFYTHCNTIVDFVGDCRALKKVQEDSNKANQSKDPKPKPPAKKNQHSPLNKMLQPPLLT